jgi:transcriptional regulator with XRE-family HTH domain
VRRIVKISDAFAIVLKQHRLAKGVTHERLAEKAGLHPTYISMLERCVRTPKLDVAESLANALGVPFSQMIAQAEVLQRKSRRKA